MTKAELLKWLQDEYRQWEALLDQIGPARMDQPGVNGHWSMKDIAAHLTGWQRRVVANLQAAQRGEPEPPPPWPTRSTFISSSSPSSKASPTTSGLSRRAGVLPRVGGR